jgi:hypothetical protein
MCDPSHIQQREPGRFGQFRSTRIEREAEGSEGKCAQGGVRSRMWLAEQTL